MEKVFLNDKIINATDARVPVTDSGFLYGMGLFETLRCTNGKVFAIEDHLERLFNSAQELSINNPYEKGYITDAINQTLAANNLTDARLRLTLTNGAMFDTEQPGPTLLITATDLVPYPPEFYQKGVTVVLTDYRQNAYDALTVHKTTNYFSRLLELNRAHQKKAAEALWFTTENHLAEGCVSNVFLVKDSVVYTPPIDTPVLPGIMRKTVLEVAQKGSVELIEKGLVISDLLSADEVFLTNIIMTILPVVGIEAHTVGDGKPGEITEKLMNYLNEVLLK